jgi:hypothetical protein
VRLTGREAKMHWQAIGIHDGVNFVCLHEARRAACSALAASA